MNKRMDRRSFIKTFGFMGLGLGTRVFVPGKAAAADLKNKPEIFSATRLAMGTYVSITLAHSSREKAMDAGEEAFEEINRLSGLMNRFDPESPVGRLNREGRLNNACPDIVEVISGALNFYRLTEGAFDITLKPILDLFREKFSGENTGYPDRREIEEALKRVGSDKIEINGRNINFKKPRMGITLDGIAKGYISDKASAVLLERGVKNHLINAGGDIKASGFRMDGRPWKMGIQDPMKKDKYLDTIYLTDGSVATSGNYESYYDKEKMVHHIADPRTGVSPVLNSSASVIAPSAMGADALATSLMVMISTQGTVFIDSLPDCESLIISKGNHMKKSRGWNKYKSNSDIALRNGHGL